MFILDALIQWLHVMAAVIWVGGMIFTSLVLQPVMRKVLPPETRMPIYRDIGTRFKKVQFSGLGILIVTGLYKLWGLRGTPEIFHSSFGTILSVKLAFVTLAVV